MSTKLLHITPNIIYDRSNPFQDFKIGNSMFSHNMWDFNGLSENNHLKGARLQIKFYEWEDKPKLLETVKWFVVHELTTGAFNTAKRVYDGLLRFKKYIDGYAYEIDSFSELSAEYLSSYFQYLLNAKNETTNELLGGQGILKAGQAIKDLLFKGNVKNWDVPNDLRYLQRLYDEIIIDDARVKSRNVKVKFLPDKIIIDQIIRLAQADLKNDNRTYMLAAASILITSQTSLRINEFITIKSGCIEKINGVILLNHTNRKLTAEDIEVIKPANELVVEAIVSLEKAIKPLQEEFGDSYLFLTRNRAKKGYPVEICSYSNWNRNYLRPWIKENQIFDSNGKLVDLTSHTFRHAFATFAIQGGASIDFVAHMMGNDIRGTQHYIKILQEDVDDRFAEVFNEKAILTGVQALTIKDKLKTNNPFKGKTIEQVKLMRKAMKIQITSHGFCTHHPMTSKKPCEGDGGVCLGCKNFLTTPEFLPVHEGRLLKVQEQLNEASENGPYEQKLKGIEKYLVGIIKDLRIQMEA